MTRNTLGRREVLAGATGTAAMSLVAGCAGGDDDDSGADGDGTDQELDPDDWEGIDEILLDGHTNGWVGVEPDLIADIRNPAFVLFESEEYEITWENADGIRHNIEIWDEDDSVVDGHRTDFLSDRGEHQTLSFTATEEMHQYVCAPHRRTMVGYVTVVTE